jgi:APA family basic amino acid/polyamine antiporter
MSPLLRKKPLHRILEEAGSGGNELRRALGPWNLIALGVGATIGVGIFVLTGTAAARNAGPALILSFLLSGIGCAFAGLCYAEFAAMLPVAGSAYTYAYAVLGEIFAWIIGWDLVLEYSFSTATVASGLSANLIGLLGEFGVHLPAAIAGTPGDGTPGAIFNLPACLSVLATTAVLIRGIRESANFNFLIVVLKVGTVLAFCATAAWFLMAHPEAGRRNWDPFLPPNAGEFGRFGWSGVMRGAAVIFFAYIGFDAVSTAAQEAVRPQRDMPVGLLGSLAVCTLLYMLTSGLLTGVVSYRDLDVGAPVALGMDRTGVHFGGMLVRVGTILGLMTTMLVTLLGQSRVFFAMSRDGLLPPFLSRVHPRFLTPHVSLLVVGCVVSIFAAIFPIGELGQLVSIGTLLAFGIVCAAVLILRYRRPDIERPFRAPLFPFVPVAGVLVSMLLMISLPGVTWLRLVIWLVVGAFVYAFYGRRSSRVREEDREPSPVAPAARG